MYSANGAIGQREKRKERLTIIFRHNSANQHVSGIEALAVSPDSSSLYTASRDSSVRRWDVTASKPACQASFEGHIDWVNHLLLYKDRLVTCSSDKTVKIWQTDEEVRCLHTVQHHSDYVTCLAASEAAGKLVSAGLRSEVITYDMQFQLGTRQLWVWADRGTTESYIRLLDPRSGQKIMKLKGHTDNVRALLLNDEGTLLLSGSSDHTVRLWDLGQQRCIQTLNVHTDSVWCLAATPDFSLVYSGGRDRAVYCTHMIMRQAWLLAREQQAIRSIMELWSYDPGPASELPLLAPAVSIPGSPGLVALRVLNDKRHILTRDSEGQVQLWDVLAARPVQQLGKVDINEEERRRFRVLFVEPWFMADVKLGSLAINLEPPKCFAAEVYALELGLRDVPDDQKVNLGASLLRSALSKWAHAFSSLHLSGAPLPGLDEPGAEQMPRFSSDLPPAVVSTSAAGVAWRLSTEAFTGHEREGEDIPPWVCDAVLRASLPYVKELKAAFVLLPAEGSGLPSLLQSRLNAPRILQVMKVANYCVTKLAELNVPLGTHEVGMTPDTQLPPFNKQQYLELTCNGMAVPYCLSIATVKKYFWKRSDDVIFHYRILDPARLAPLPMFGPDP
eukprot:gene5150-5390_t